MDNVMKEALDVAPKSPVPASNSVSSPGVMETPPAVSLCLRAPLVLHNLLCVPMLYRIADRQVGRGGFIGLVAESSRAWGAADSENFLRT